MIDIENTAKLLTQNELSLEEIAAITDKVYLVMFLFFLKPDWLFL